MKRHHQHGMSTLLITSLLLIVALIFSLASYKNLFYQIKRTQNEVLSREAHWLSEGGLECGFAKVNSEKNFDLIEKEDYFQLDCANKLGLKAILANKVNKVYQLSSEYKDQNVNKKTYKAFSLNKGASGALKSTADLYIRGSSTFSTPDPGDFKEDGWECVAIRYKNIFSSLAGATNQGVLHGAPPSKDFAHNGKDCKPTHKTVTSNDSNYRNDFVKDHNLDPFYDTFGETRDKWKEIKKDWKFSEILSDKIVEAPAGKKFNVVDKCGSKIASQISLGKQRIWVSGSCEIAGSEIEVIKKAFNETSNKPILLLVHNGIFSVQGSMEFPGLLYHLTTGFTPTEELWDKFEAKSFFGNYSLFPTLSKAKTVYFQYGSFVFSGGQILDTSGLAAYFDQSLNFAFNSDNIDEVTEKGKIKWVEGSWHDFK